MDLSALNRQFDSCRLDMLTFRQILSQTQESRIAGIGRLMPSTNRLPPAFTQATTAGILIPRCAPKLSLYTRLQIAASKELCGDA